MAESTYTMPLRIVTKATTAPSPRLQISRRADRAPFPARAPSSFVRTHHQLDLSGRLTQRLEGVRQLLQAHDVSDHGARINAAGVEQVEHQTPVRTPVAQDELDIDLLEDGRHGNHCVFDHADADNDHSAEGSREIDALLYHSGHADAFEYDVWGGACLFRESLSDVFLARIDDRRGPQRPRRLSPRVGIFADDHIARARQFREYGDGQADRAAAHDQDALAHSDFAAGDGVEPDSQRFGSRPFPTLDGRRQAQSFHCVEFDVFGIGALRGRTESRQRVLGAHDAEIVLAFAEPE